MASSHCRKLHIYIFFKHHLFHLFVLFQDGSHPFYLEVRNKKAHGVFLRNSNGMDIMLGDSSLTYRVIGGEGDAIKSAQKNWVSVSTLLPCVVDAGVLDFYFFVSEMGWPDEIIRSYQEVIGRPAMPPYWALGYHQSRQGYRHLGEVREVVGNFSASRVRISGNIMTFRVFFFF